jgi:hypothetical protein
MQTYRRKRLIVTLVTLLSLSLFARSLGDIAPGARANDPVAALRAWLKQPGDHRPDLAQQPFATSPLTKSQGADAARLLRDDQIKNFRATRAGEWKAEAITIGEHTLKWKRKFVGKKPPGGWNLFISMHGGGSAPASVNDQQWDNQIGLYSPKDSLYIAPRAPTDTWNLWHEAHIDPLFARLIADAIALADVDPNRVYVMGYSAGGDGVYQLAPRMADSWAAASMMAGHPNDASPLGLRNIGFTIHVGALDNGYNRNKVALEWGDKLDQLQKDDPGGYVHEVRLHSGKGHWMNLEDAVAVDWMAKFTRNPIPDKVVWKQSPVTHDRFYWLALPLGEAKGGQLAVVSRKKQNIQIEKIEGIQHLLIMLNDAMLDLDKPVVISVNGKELFNGVPPRTMANLHQTLEARGDPGLTFPAVVPVEIP